MAYFSGKTYLSYPKAYSSGVGTLSKESYVLTEATNIVIDGDYNYVTFTHSLYGKADKKVTATANLTAAFDSTKSVSKEVTLTTSIKKLITLTETVECEFGIETNVSGSLSTGVFDGGYGITTDPDAWSHTTEPLYTFGRVTSYNKHEKYAVPFTITLSKPGNYRLEFYENSESEVCRHTVEFSGDSVDVTIPATVYKEVGGDLTRMKCFEQAQGVWVIADSESVTVSETACSISIKAVRSPSDTDPSLVTIAVKGESAASSAYRTVTIYAKETSASEWAVIGTASPDTSSFSETLSIDLSIDYTWDIYASVSDGYIDGVGTIIDNCINVGTDLGLNTVGQVVTLVVTQVVAFAFSLIFVKLTKKYTTTFLLKVCILGYFAVCLYALTLHDLVGFAILAMGVGMFQGSIQSLSRSYFTKIIPKAKSGEYFGIYDIFSKGASFLGSAVLAAVKLLGFSANIAVASLAVFFLLGFLAIRIAEKTPASGDAAGAETGAGGKDAAAPSV